VACPVKQAIVSTLRSQGQAPALALILTHIFLGRLEKPITMDVFVKQSTVALGLSSCFTKLNCKMWVKDRALAVGSLD